MMRTSISGQKAEQIIRAINPQKGEEEATRAADRWLQIYVELSEWRGKTYEDAFQLVMRAVEAHPIHPPDGVLMADVMQLVDAVDELALKMSRSVDRVWRAVDALRDRDKLTAQRLEAVRELWNIDRAAGCSPHFPMDFTGPIAAGVGKPLAMRLRETDLLRGLNVEEYFTPVATTQNAFVPVVDDLPKPRGTISEAERKRRNKARKTAKQARRRNRGR